MHTYHEDDHKLYKECIAKLLFDLRNKNQLTLEEVANRVKTTRQSMSLYENCSKLPQMWTIKRIAESFGMSLEGFVGLLEKEFKKQRRNRNAGKRTH